MQENMIAIDEVAFDDLIMKFYKVKEELNATLSNIDSLICSYGDTYKSDANAKLVSKWKSYMKTNVSTVLDNMEIYISDLKAVRTNIDVFDSRLSLRIYEEK